MNQHATLINSLQVNLETKANTLDLPVIISTITEGTSIFDNELNKLITPLMQKGIRNEGVQINLENVQNKFINKQLAHSHAFTVLMNRVRTIEPQLPHILSDIKNKVEAKVWREKKKKHKKMFKELSRNV